MSSCGSHMATSPPTLTPIPAPAIGNLEYDSDDLFQSFRAHLVQLMWILIYSKYFFFVFVVARM